MMGGRCRRPGQRHRKAGEGIAKRSERVRYVGEKKGSHCKMTNKQGKGKTKRKVGQAATKFECCSVGGWRNGWMDCPTRSGWLRCCEVIGGDSLRRARDKAPGSTEGGGGDTTWPIEVYGGLVSKGELGELASIGVRCTEQVGDRTGALFIACPPAISLFPLFYRVQRSCSCPAGVRGSFTASGPPDLKSKWAR